MFYVAAWFATPDVSARAIGRTARLLQRVIKACRLQRAGKGV